MDSKLINKMVYGSRVSKRSVEPGKRVSKQSIRNQKVIIQMRSYVNQAHTDGGDVPDGNGDNHKDLSETQDDSAEPSSSSLDTNPPAKALFSGCRIFINGTTSPHISDYLLRQKLIERGARLVTSLPSSSARGLTHMLLGGNLSASRRNKLQDHPGLKVVSVLWALDSIKFNERQLEAKYKCETYLRDETQGNLKGFMR